MMIEYWWFLFLLHSDSCAHDICRGTFLHCARIGDLKSEILSALVYFKYLLEKTLALLFISEKATLLRSNQKAYTWN
jgi:hypothetical protein